MARGVFQIARYNPGRRTAKINCPVLFAICNTDSVTPAGPSLKYARKARRRKIAVYDGGPFDVYVGEEHPHRRRRDTEHRATVV